MDEIPRKVQVSALTPIVVEGVVAVLPAEASDVAAANTAGSAGRN
jgi:hypothetical protein